VCASRTFPLSALHAVRVLVCRVHCYYPAGSLALWFFGPIYLSNNLARARVRSLSPSLSPCLPCARTQVMQDAATQQPAGGSGSAGAGSIEHGATGAQTLEWRQFRWILSDLIACSHALIPCRQNTHVSQPAIMTSGVVYVLCSAYVCVCVVHVCERERARERARESEREREREKREKERKRERERDQERERQRERQRERERERKRERERERERERACVCLSMCVCLCVCARMCVCLCV